MQPMCLLLCRQRSSGHLACGWLSHGIDFNYFNREGLQRDCCLESVNMLVIIGYPNDKQNQGLNPLGFAVGRKLLIVSVLQSLMG